MFELEVRGTFDAAHQVNGYPGKCARLHGHSWTVEACVAGSQLNELGILVDFSELNHLLKEILSQLDHQNLNELPMFRDTNPTAENIAKYVYDQLAASQLLAQSEASLDSVCVWESAHSCVRYHKGKS